MRESVPLDIAAIRARFPALARPLPGGGRIVHADAPGGTQILQDVLDAMHDYLVTSSANQHGAFPPSEQTDALCARVRAQAAAFTGGHPEGVVFGPNMTTLTWHFSHTLDDLVAGGEIVCTRLDHDANVAPWLALARRAEATVRWVDVNPDTLQLRTDDVFSVVSERTRLVTFPLASNAFGTLVDPAPFVAAARAAGAITFCDAVHAAPHVALDRAGAGIDVLVCSPYKFFGPHQGVMSAEPRLLAELTPDRVRAAPEHGPDRWQTGTASFEAIAGCGAALAYLETLGMHAITAHERGLSERFLAGLADLPKVRLYGGSDPAQRTPTFAITVDGLAPVEVSTRLAAAGIWTWSGHCYALEPMRALGLLDAGGVVRVGFVHYHDAADVDRVLEGLAPRA